MMSCTQQPATGSPLVDDGGTGDKQETATGQQSHSLTHNLEWVKFPVVLTTRSSTCLYADSSPSWISPITVVSSANFRSFTDGSAEVQSFRGRSRERTVRVRHTDKLREGMNEDTNESKLSLAAMERQFILSEELLCVTAFY
ncbi:hypothetical protein ATANTOWER_016319 [Ataeniobius toweri]|uniref:Uncharacterized protein n=1 Tax=Ataeniobius toweri TaxID=208326 RepID=A0ABU7A6N7_9TELE|nr:hypothetical protein [Ataeniobius toweri]